ncbi:MAG: M55 family metallopeptidase [Holophaga sp.]|jgi:D-amino peptidase
MSRIYISADIEGVCGIADWKETDLAEVQGAYFREQMTREVAAACEGAQAAGATEILVKDAHSTGRNINPAALPQCVRIVRSSARNPLTMMAGLDRGFDAAVFIGYHSGAGSAGNPLAHTMNRDNSRVLVNGEEASEFLLNAYTAASFGIPVAAVSGDRDLCERVAAHNRNIRTVAVNEGLGSAVISIHPALAAARIREAVAEALKADPASCRLPLPDRFELAIEFREHFLAYRGSFYPGARQAGPRTVTYACAEWMDALRFMFFVL